MRSSEDFVVFERWRHESDYAFGRKNEAGVVPEADRDSYQRVHEELVAAANETVSAIRSPLELVVRPKGFSRNRGVRGHRPNDLYVSICSTDAEATSWYPQVYAIASHRGLEVGFAVSISEKDYFDVKSKERNRSVVPFINSNLPGPGSPLTSTVETALRNQGGWHFNTKTRLIPGDTGFDAFGSLAELFAHLKARGAATGGGTICRVFPLEQLRNLDLASELRAALADFMPIIERCIPTPWDLRVWENQSQVESEPPRGFDPAGVQDGRRKILRAVAQRQGQSKFRADLLDAYDAQCAISRTNVTDVLQAAHISPYMGPETNDVTNGLLLRADLHTLFDLGLIRINPNSLRVSVSPSLKGSAYWEFEGTEIYRPKKPRCGPSLAALTAHFTDVPRSMKPSSQPPASELSVD
jgi:hypothetical protein